MLVFWILFGMTFLLFGADFHAQWTDKTIGRNQRIFHVSVMFFCIALLWVGLFILGVGSPDNFWWFKFW